MSDDNIIKFTELLNDSPEYERPKAIKFPNRKSKSRSESQVRAYYALMTSTMNGCKTIDKEVFADGIINEAFVPVTREETDKYVDVMSKSNTEDGWAILFFTTCAIWHKIIEDLTVGIDFSHLESYLKNDSAMGAFEADSNREGALQKYYASHLSAVTCYSFVLSRRQLEEMLPEIGDPLMNELAESERSFLTPFILITLAILTIQMVKLKVIDCSVLNEWCQTSNLDKHSSKGEVLNSARTYFGKRLRDLQDGNT